jgi:Uma2 family endonuclease
VLTYLAHVNIWSPALRSTPKEGSRELTVDEWVALPEDDEGELVQGRLVEEEVADPIHGLSVSWFIALLRAWLAGRGGFVFDSDVKLVVSDKGGRKPDVTVYFPERPAPPRRGALREPPDIAVEVISASPRDERRDRVEKMSEYAAFGVRSYWLLDPALGSFEVFELDPSGRYVRALSATDGRVTNIPRCDGLVLDLDALWAELERLAPEGE